MNSSSRPPASFCPRTMGPTCTGRYRALPPRESRAGCRAAVISCPGESTTMLSTRFLQLAHVPRPRIVDEQLHRVGGDAVEDARSCCWPRVLDEAAHEQRDVVAPLAQRRQVDVQHVEPVVQIRAELAALHRARAAARFVAAMTRTSTWIGCAPPTRVNSRSSSTRSSLTCVRRRRARRSRRGRACRRRPARSAPAAARRRR